MSAVLLLGLGAVAVIAMAKLVENPVIQVAPQGALETVAQRFPMGEKTIYPTGSAVAKLFGGSGLAGEQFVVEPATWESNLPALKIISTASPGTVCVVSRIPPALMSRQF